MINYFKQTLQNVYKHTFVYKRNYIKFDIKIGKNNISEIFLVVFIQISIMLCLKELKFDNFRWFSAVKELVSAVKELLVRSKQNPHPNKRYHKQKIIIVIGCLEDGL